MPTCIALDCERIKILARTMCVKHYKRWHQGISDPALAHVPRRAGESCRVPSCDRLHYSDGYCNGHWQRIRLTGDLKPDRPFLVRGQHRYVDDDGYVVLWEPDHFAASRKGSLFEHQKVIAEHLGRRLRPRETVHHRNGVRSDNRIENLELWSGMHPRGARVSDQVAWALEVIALYGSDPEVWK